MERYIGMDVPMTDHPSPLIRVHLGHRKKKLHFRGVRSVVHPSTRESGPIREIRQWLGADFPRPHRHSEAAVLPALVGA